MRTIHPARERFRALLREPEARLNLAEAALCVAWEEQGTGNPADGLRELDALAAAARPYLAGCAHPREVVNGLNRCIFGELGFKGNTWNYGDVANSFLDCVLATRAGLPILLSVVYMEVGWRLGLPISGVALPGHFLARYGAGDNELYIDPFNRGRLWSRDECVTQILTFYGEGPPAMVARIMAPPTRRAILARILRNLKNLYVEQGALPKALATIDRILLLEPDAAQEVRDRGLMRARLGAVSGALEDLERYARMVPRAPDLAHIRREARALAERAAAGN